MCHFDHSRPVFPVQKTVMTIPCPLHTRLLDLCLSVAWWCVCVCVFNVYIIGDIRKACTGWKNVLFWSHISQYSLNVRTSWLKVQARSCRCNRRRAGSSFSNNTPFHLTWKLALCIKYSHTKCADSPSWKISISLTSHDWEFALIFWAVTNRPRMGTEQVKSISLFGSALLWLLGSSQGQFTVISDCAGVTGVMSVSPTLTCVEYMHVHIRSTHASYFICVLL